MFKRRVNEAEIEIAISPETPLLIKAGDTGADPTQPDMEFVRTYHASGETIYLPGSSLKGAVRAHAERIVRTVGGTAPGPSIWSCNPLDERSTCRTMSKDCSAEVAYRESCAICKMFGSTEIASHYTSGDAYPEGPVTLEERNGVAIDRVYGSVAVGPFNYQVATQGRFVTTLRMVNFSLDQLGLLALTLRDFSKQRVSLGFGKSRGLGQVALDIRKVTLRYPGSILEGSTIKALGRKISFDGSKVAGAGSLFAEARDYGFPVPDLVEARATPAPEDLGLAVTQSFTGDDLTALWQACVQQWRVRLEEGVTAR